MSLFDFLVSLLKTLVSLFDFLMRLSQILVSLFNFLVTILIAVLSVLHFSGRNLGPLATLTKGEGTRRGTHLIAS